LSSSHRAYNHDPYNNDADNDNVPGRAVMLMYNSRAKTMAAVQYHVSMAYQLVVKREAKQLVKGVKKCLSYNVPTNGWTDGRERGRRWEKNTPLPKPKPINSAPVSAALTQTSQTIERG
jgi:hypothetical protein